VVNGSRRHLIRRPRALRRSRVTFVTACPPTRWLPGVRLGSRLPTRTSAFTRSRVVTAASLLAFACASTFITRDRPAAPKQSADAGTADESVTTGPTGALGHKAGTSPEVSVPSAHVSRVALPRGRPASRDDPAPAFHARRARAFGREPSFGGVSPLRFFALVAGSSVALLTRWTCGTGRSIISQTCRAVASTHSMIEWTCGSRRLHDSSRKCGRRNRSPHARDQPDRSSLAARRSRRPSRVMHRRVL